MPHSIFALNQKPLRKIVPRELCQALKSVHFSTLCEQYNLDPAHIPEVKGNLKVIAAAEEVLPYFVVSYLGAGERPILVHQSCVDTEEGGRMVQNFIAQDPPDVVIEHLSKVTCLLRIELSASQLQDMGLLLAYEVARWTAAKGEGLVLGFDGNWYRLNRNHAFIPLKSK